MDKWGQVLWSSSTDSSCLGIGAECKPLLLGSSTAGLSWSHPFFFVLPLVVERHLLCIWLRPQAALFSLVTAVQWEGSSQFLLCVCSPEQIWCLLVSLSVLWKVQFHSRQWNRHLIQSLVCLLWRLVSCLFLGFFCVCVRKEGVFTGIEITHFTGGGPDTESKELFRHLLPAF